MLVQHTWWYTSPRAKCVCALLLFDDSCMSHSMPWPSPLAQTSMHRGMSESFSLFAAAQTTERLQSIHTEDRATRLGAMCV